MKTMILKEQGKPLIPAELPIPNPNNNQVLIKVHACGVCRTDLHIADGELINPKLPLVLGHEITGTVVKAGKDVSNFSEGDRVGVPWLGYTCGKCKYCLRGMENLCENALFTGYTIDGGYAEYTVADHRYCFNINESYSFPEAAPVLCAGLIGYRSYRLATEQKETKNIGIYGFGAAAHIITQVAVYMGKKIYAFTRPGDLRAQEFAKSLGTVWVGDSNQMPPVKLDASIIFAPAGELIPIALKATDKGGMVVCGGIHMSDIPRFPYELLWEERIVRSVANLTRKDGQEFFKIVSEIPVKTEVQTFPLSDANEALARLRKGKIKGAAVLTMNND